MTPVHLPRAVVPLVAAALAVAGLVLVPRWTADASDLDAAASILTLPGTAVVCADGAARCARTDLAPRAAVRELEKQVHDLGLHDQATTCTPKVAQGGRPQRCELVVRDGGRRLVVVTDGVPGGDAVSLRLEG